MYALKIENRMHLYMYALKIENRMEGNDRESWNYPTSSVQDIKGKEGRSKSNVLIIKTLQAESRKDSLFPKNWPNGYPK